MRRFITVSCTALLVATATGTAAATGGYAPPQRVLSCAAGAQVAAVADGSVWGVSQCNQAMSLVHRTAGGVWSTRALPFRGFPRAVADDGMTTFFLFASPNSPADNALSIAKVPHGGAPSAARVLAQYSENTVNAGLVARDGEWWAVWDQVAYAGERQSYSSRLMQARTIQPAFSPRPVDLGSTHDFQPRLALRGHGAVLVAKRGLGADGFGGTSPVLATSGSEGQFTSRDLGVPLSTSSYAHDLVVAGGRTLIALQDGTRTLLAQDDGSLTFTTRLVPTRAASSNVQLAASYGRVFVAHSEYFHASSGADTERAYVAEAGSTGPFTTTEVSAPFGRTNPAVTVDLVDVAAVRAHATVLTALTSGTWSQTQH
ncbi:MAG: hypothetical protein LC779_02810 [Actinobacteria bacterium]|nr:hypothetical protein [Actinomycetota bacterium]